MKTIIDEIRKELRQNADKKIRENGRRYFKEAIKTYGTKTAFVSKLAKRYFDQVKDLNKAVVFKLCETLWQSGYLEESFIACEWAYRMRERYRNEDFSIFEKWVNRYVSNWASCDTLCNHAVGTLVDMYPNNLYKLKNWARSKNRWTKRAAAVTLIVPARNGRYLKEIFEIADILLLDNDDLVQKGYGWMLKAASEPHQKEVFDYVMKNKNRMPRTALRYSIEKMPEKLKAKAMA